MTEQVKTLLMLLCMRIITKQPQYVKVSFITANLILGFPGGSEVKASAWNAGDPGLIPRSGTSPGEGNDNPLQYFYLENPMEAGAW